MNKQYNHMLDVAFTVVSEHENWEDIHIMDILHALRSRVQILVLDVENAREAFGYNDTYEIEIEEGEA